MNARDYKLFRAGEYYHIYNRGDNKEQIFLDDQDYLNFLKRLKLALGIADIRTELRIIPLPANSFDILAYCLMPNHFHFLIKQNTNLAIGELISKVCTSYVKYFNKRYERVGNLFQDIFKAKHIDSDEYITYLSAYIHNNPSDPFNYAYSSLLNYLTATNDVLCNKDFILKYFNSDTIAYKNFVESCSDEKILLNIKHLTFED